MMDRIRYHVYSDFDGTLVDSFSPSASGVGVNEACSIAVLSIFGEDVASIYENELGGLQNREPFELIKTLYDSGASLDRSVSIQEATQRFVDMKVSLLLPSFTSEWPQFYPGVKEFLTEIAQEKLPLDLTVVSSGHDEVIAKVFTENGLPIPNMVTSDTVRNKKFPTRDKFKPHTYQLSVAHHRVFHKEDEAVSVHTESGYYANRGDKPFMMYLGDDPIKDGGLAENARIIYGFVPFMKPDYTPFLEKGQILVEDFHHLLDKLKAHSELLDEGRSLSEILLGRKDSETFPPLSTRERPYKRWISEGGYRPGGERMGY